jgi:hypothetical protein
LVVKVVGYVQDINMRFKDYITESKEGTPYELIDMLKYLPVKETARSITDQLIKDIENYYKNGTPLKSKKYIASIKDKCMKPYTVDTDFILSNNDSYVNDAQEDYINFKIYKREKADANTQKWHINKLKKEIYDIVEHECGHYFLSQKGVETCIYHSQGMSKYYYDRQEMVLHSQNIYNNFVESNPNWMFLDEPVIKKKLQIGIRMLPSITRISAPFPTSLQSKYVTLIMKTYIQPALKGKK